MAISIAARFITGSAPGRARTVGSISVFGAAPSNSVEAGFGARLNTLLRVASSTCTSLPTINWTERVSALGGGRAVPPQADDKREGAVVGVGGGHGGSLRGREHRQALGPHAVDAEPVHARRLLRRQRGGPGAAGR